MADYWKSQPKHFCEFCSCWIADNKPSREYHEKGKKHQQNVQAKISQIHKKSREDAKRKTEMNSYLKEMEKKALAAAKRDLQGDPSLATLYGVKPKEHGPENRPQEASEPQKKVEPEVEPDNKPTAEEPDYSAPEYWDEDTTPEGYTYYWNTVTRESRWVAPEGYIPKAERIQVPETTETTEEISKQESAETGRDIRSSEEVESRGEKRKLEEEESPSEADKTSQDLVEIPSVVKDVSAKPLPGSLTDGSSPPPEPESQEQPVQRPERQIHSAYSQWEVAKEPEPEEPVDLQLPETNTVEEKLVTVHAEPKIKFREKTVSSLSRENLPAVFRKKKKGIGYKNLKPRTDDL